MAVLLLTAAASALTAGASAFVQLAAAAVATAAGAYIDGRLFGASGNSKQEGPRLDSLTVQASTEGAALPEIAGRVRIAGQIIWATKFKEVATTKTESAGGKGGGGASVSTTTYAYFANFAVGLCEGPIDRIGRIWADGKIMDLKGVTWRVHRGTATQDPDSLIEGIEGADNAPAYCGTAYVVFENLALADFGNRIPQLTFEVFRRVSPADGSGLEDLIEAVTLIPGAGERTYDPVIVTRDLGGGVTFPENAFAGQADADWTVSLDDLQASLPNLKTVFLVVGWFGDDLRCGLCTLRPKVEVTAKTTSPFAWMVHGLARASATTVSTVDGKPAYGGTPSDDAVVRAIRDLKARGIGVVVYPFVFMDIPTGNSLPDPWTAANGQPAYPWRGRITSSPAPGRPGTADKTAAAATQVASFFGSVTRGQISVSVNGTTNVVTTSYSGPNEWSYRRFILHYARLAAAINAIAPGAITGFLIGSELRALVGLRDSSSHFPAVDHLKTLAADAKAILGSGVKIGYAADWSDWNGHRPSDGSGDLFFHLDPLWSDANIDFIGIDLYAPLSDWRDGMAHLDAEAGALSIYDHAYLQSNIEGGEDYDWYYASDADRDSQTRSAITDGAHGKPWVWRAKDVRHWWLNQHFHRPGGVESATPTDWVPQSKPIWFTEVGVPSIDKGTNQPNVFYDPKSSESAFPHFSRGTRDDLIQRRGLEAVLGYWRVGAGHNPVSTVYSGRMIATAAVWTWDARPYPAWPARTDAWSDGVLWPYGHWLTGKIGLADLSALVAERCARVGFADVDVSGLTGVVVGYVRDRPMSPRAELEMLMQAFAFDAVESDGQISFVPRGRQPVLSVAADECVAPDGGSSGNAGETILLTRAQETDLPDIVSVGFIDGNENYQTGSVASSRLAGWSDRKSDMSFALVMDDIAATNIADRVLAESWIGRESAKLALPPSLIALDPGDVINLNVGGRARAFRLTRIVDGVARDCELTRAEAAVYAPALPGTLAPTISVPPTYGAALLAILDLPVLSDADLPWTLHAAVTSSPFAGIAVLDSATGSSFKLDAELPLRATMGVTTAAFNAGTTTIWDRANTLSVKLHSGELSSRTEAEILAGSFNALAIANGDGQWEIVQFATATLTGADTYDLTLLLRGRLGTEHAIKPALAAGATVVLLDGAVGSLNAALSERGVARFYKWGPLPLAQSDPAFQQTTFTLKAVGLMPWSPVHVRASRNAAGDLSITWIRRTRYGGTWADGADVALNEESERYEVDIFNGANVVRTIASTTPAAGYSAAQQMADFGAVQSAVSVKVYQISATAGRGRAATATL